MSTSFPSSSVSTKNSSNHLENTCSLSFTHKRWTLETAALRAHLSLRSRSLVHGGYASSTPLRPLTHHNGSLQAARCKQHCETMSGESARKLFTPHRHPPREQQVWSPDRRHHIWYTLPYLVWSGRSGSWRNNTTTQAGGAGAGGAACAGGAPMQVHRVEQEDEEFVPPFHVLRLWQL